MSLIDILNRFSSKCVHSILQYICVYMLEPLSTTMFGAVVLGLKVGMNRQCALKDCNVFKQLHRKSMFSGESGPHHLKHPILFENSLIIWFYKFCGTLISTPYILYGYQCGFSHASLGHVKVRGQDMFNHHQKSHINAQEDTCPIALLCKLVSGSHMSLRL